MRGFYRVTLSLSSPYLGIGRPAAAHHPFVNVFSHHKSEAAHQRGQKAKRVDAAPGRPPGIPVVSIGKTQWAFLQAVSVGRTRIASQEPQTPSGNHERPPVPPIVRKTTLPALTTAARERGCRWCGILATHFCVASERFLRAQRGHRVQRDVFRGVGGFALVPYQALPVNGPAILGHRIGTASDLAARRNCIPVSR